MSEKFACEPMTLTVVSSHHSVDVTCYRYRAHKLERRKHAAVGGVETKLLRHLSQRGIDRIFTSRNVSGAATSVPEVGPRVLTRGSSLDKDLREIFLIRIDLFNASKLNSSGPG